MKTSPDEMQSIRSKRSLSINVNKVSKIVKLSKDGMSAISKGNKTMMQNARGDVISTTSRRNSC